MSAHRSTSLVEVSRGVATMQAGRHTVRRHQTTRERKMCCHLEAYVRACRTHASRLCFRHIQSKQWQGRGRSLRRARPTTSSGVRARGALGISPLYTCVCRSKGPWVAPRAQPSESRPEVRAEFSELHDRSLSRHRDRRERHLSRI